MKSFRGILLNGHTGGSEFFSGGLPGQGSQFFLEECDLHRDYGMVVILSQLPWWKMAFYRFKVRSISGMSVTLEGSKKKYQNP